MFKPENDFECTCSACEGRRIEGAEKDFIHPALVLATCIGLAVLLLLFRGCTAAWADEIKIDMSRIAKIESNGNPRAHNKKDDSRGLYQITPICLKEYNIFHPGAAFSMDDLWNTSVSSAIAEWYLNIRIPQMLKHYGIPDTVPNRIVAWNAGISYLVNKKPLPKITKLYLKKYGIRVVGGQKSMGEA